MVASRIPHSRDPLHPSLSLALSGDVHRLTCGERSKSGSARSSAFWVRNTQAPRYNCTTLPITMTSPRRLCRHPAICIRRCSGIGKQGVIREPLGMSCSQPCLVDTNLGCRDPQTSRAFSKACSDLKKTHSPASFWRSQHHASAATKPPHRRGNAHAGAFAFFSPRHSGHDCMSLLDSDQSVDAVLAQFDRRAS